MSEVNFSDLLETLKQSFPKRIKFGKDVQDEVKFALLSLCTRLKRRSKASKYLTQVEAVLDRIWQELNMGHWSKVSNDIREAYSLGSYIKILFIIRNHLEENGSPQSCLSDAIEAADMGLILGSSLRDELQNAANILTDAFYEGVKLERSIIPEEEDNEMDWSFPGIKGSLVPSLECPSLEYFHMHHFLPCTPAKLTGCIRHWPALKNWRDMNYLIRKAGPRKVPIELGSSYMQDDFSVKLVTIHEFINTHIMKKSSAKGYLAQHQLFNQIPELKEDIRTPEYCCLSESDDDECPVDVNAWFGPAGTVSPLHHDPKHNLLTQVVGRKRIILYSPGDSPNLYPYNSEMNSNTAQVEPYSPDYEQFPKFQSAQAWECHLHPGEILYIPPKWWHHVRSLDVSFSVSFWWE